MSIYECYTDFFKYILQKFDLIGLYKMPNDAKRGNVCATAAEALCGATLDSVEVISQFV